MVVMHAANDVGEHNDLDQVSQNCSPKSSSLPSFNK